MNLPKMNNVKNRFLPIPEAVAKCLEPEPKIQDFDIIKELGAGSFGHVYLVTHKVTKCQYAIKAIDKRNKTNIEEKPYFRREIEIMYKIHHPNVVRLFSHFEDDNYCYFIMEYINKGNIYNLIPKDRTKRLSAQVVATLMKDVISAVYFLHNMNPPIIHRDIKPENVLLAEGRVAKLTDFGWSNYMQGDEKRTTVCGTPIYLAPEIINETGHDERVDIWCIGVLLFELVTGNVPFLGNDIDTLKSNIRHMKIAWPRDISMDAKNLIMKILKYDPKARISLVEMLNHPFFTKHIPNASEFLIKPDETLQTMPFVVSKDNPKNPPTIIKPEQPKVEPKEESAKKEPQSQRGRDREKMRNRDISPVPISKLHLDKLNITKLQNMINDKDPEEDYSTLKKKYEQLSKDYNAIKKGTGSQKDIDIITCQKNDLAKEVVLLKEQLKEKDAKLVSLLKAANLEKQTSGNIDEDEKESANKIKELERENEILKEKVLKYEKCLTEQGNPNIDKKIKQLRDSLNSGNKDKIFEEIEKLKSDMDEKTKRHFIMILNEKDKQLQNEVNLREKDKKKYTNLINKYDNTLTFLNKENKELKAKIKELESKGTK